MATPPPEPLELVDGLREQKHTQNLAMGRNASKKKLVLVEIEEARDVLREAEKKLRQHMEKPKEGAEKLRQSWLYEFAKLEKEMVEHLLLSAQANLQALDEDSRNQQKEMDLSSGNCKRRWSTWLSLKSNSTGNW